MTNMTATATELDFNTICSTFCATLDAWRRKRPAPSSSSSTSSAPKRRALEPWTVNSTLMNAVYKVPGWILRDAIETVLKTKLKTPEQFTWSKESEKKKGFTKIDFKTVPSVSLHIWRVSKDNTTTVCVNASDPMEIVWMVHWLYDVYRKIPSAPPVEAPNYVQVYNTINARAMWYTFLPRACRETMPDAFDEEKAKSHTVEWSKVKGVDPNTKYADVHNIPPSTEDGTGLTDFFGTLARCTDTMDRYVELVWTPCVADHPNMEPKTQLLKQALEEWKNRHAERQQRLGDAEWVRQEYRSFVTRLLLAEPEPEPETEEEEIEWV